MVNHSLTPKDSKDDIHVIKTRTSQEFLMKNCPTRLENLLEEGSNAGDLGTLLSLEALGLFCGEEMVKFCREKKWIAVEIERGSS